MEISVALAVGDGRLCAVSEIVGNDTAFLRKPEGMQPYVMVSKILSGEIFVYGLLHTPVDEAA